MNDADRLVDECYAEDTAARAMGFPAVIRGREQMRAGMRAAVQAAPRRYLRVDHLHAAVTSVSSRPRSGIRTAAPTGRRSFAPCLRSATDSSSTTWSDSHLRRWPGISEALADKG